MKVCFRCRKQIEEKENYMAFTEYNNKKLIKTDYTHKQCWDDFLAKISSTAKAQDFLSRVSLEPLERLGLIKPKEVRI